MTKKTANKTTQNHTNDINPNLPSTDLDAYEQLNEVQKKVVEMRLQGYKYRHIVAMLSSENLKISENTVRWWFTKKSTGLIYRAYLERKKMRAKEDKVAFQQASKELDSLIGDAVLVIRTAIGKGNVDVAMKLLESKGIIGDKAKPISPRSEALDLVNELIDIERRKLEAKANDHDKPAK